ncbi:MAG: hypothetical protein GC181_00440 [Bacteroidetes bacterium]|nr:hypothetical protein [Bacteroidota bacterium]
MNRKIILIFSVAVLLVVGCRRDKKVWESNYLLPIFQTDLSIDDLVADSLLNVNSDGSYSLVYRHTIAIDSVANYLTVPDTVDTVNVKLQKLVLDDRSLMDTFTLREMDPSAGLLDGFTVPLEAYDIKDAGGEQEIDVSEAFFQTAKFKEGFLDVTLHNDLPVYVDMIVFQLTNKNDGSIVIKDTFTDIPQFASATKSISLAGKQVNGILLGKVLRVKTRASTGPVLVDADKGVRIEMIVRDLKPEYATAIFPAQTLVSDTQEVKYDFGGAQITELRARSGFVKMKIFSTIEEEIIINYSFPFSGENGDYSKPFDRQYSVPPASPGTTQKIEVSFPLDGFALQYKGKDPLNPPFTNTVYSRLTARTVYSGKVRNLSLDDSVYIEFGLVDVVPEFAFGDFGSKSYDLDEKIDVKALHNVLGTIDLEKVSMRLTYDNLFGMQAMTTVNSIVADNTRTNKQTTLMNSDFIGQDILIGKASNPPLTPFKRIYNFDQSNSNIKDFVETLPDNISANINLVTRPNGSYDFTDFIFYDSYLKAHLDLEIPLNFAMHNMQFVRKTSFSLGDVSNNQKIKSGTFKLKVDNDFPLEAKIEMEFLDDNENVILTLFKTDNTIAAATIPGTQEKTKSPQTSWLIASVNATDMDLLRNATKVRVTANFDTPSGNRTKIFNSYQLKTKLIADFVYEQGV